MGNSPSNNEEKVESHEELLLCVNNANQLVSKFIDSQGRTLKFELFPRNKKEIALPFLWKLIIHVQVSRTGSNELPKKLSYKQFFAVYTRLKELIKLNTTPDLSASYFLTGFLDTASEDKECVICMERSATIMLTCLHCFCDECLKEWQQKSETCPLCRMKFSTHDQDNFVITSAASDEEVGAYFLDYLDNVVK